MPVLTRYRTQPRLNKVAAVVDLFAVGLFGGHVRRRADDVAGSGKAQSSSRMRGQAEVDQFDAIAVGIRARCWSGFTSR